MSTTIDPVPRSTGKCEVDAGGLTTTSDVGELGEGEGDREIGRRHGQTPGAVAEVGKPVVALAIGRGRNAAEARSTVDPARRDGDSRNHIAGRVLHDAADGPGRQAAGVEGQIDAGDRLVAADGDGRRIRERTPTDERVGGDGVVPIGGRRKP